MLIRPSLWRALMTLNIVQLCSVCARGRANNLYHYMLRARLWTAYLTSYLMHCHTLFAPQWEWEKEKEGGSSVYVPIYSTTTVCSMWCWYVACAQAGSYSTYHAGIGLLTGVEGGNV